MELTCDGKIRLEIEKATQIFGGILTTLLVGGVALFVLEISVFWHN